MSVKTFQFGENIKVNMISNGVQNTAANRSSSMDRDNFVFQPMENLNWLMHMFYIQRRSEKTRFIIEEQINRSAGRNEYAHYLSASILADENKLEEALQQFQVCNRLNPANIEYIKQIAKCLFRQKRYKLCLEALMEAENLSKKPDWEIHYWIAECLTCLGSPESAVQWSKRASRNNTSSGVPPLAAAQLARLLTKIQDVQGALDAYNIALQGCPDDPDLLTEAGLLHAKLDQQQLAVERLGSALALGPPTVSALLPLASIMQSHGDYDVALSRYKIAVQLSPDSPFVWNNIGMCFYGKKRFVAAVSCLKRANSLNPLSRRVLHNLGLVHFVCQQYCSAFQYLCAALNFEDCDPATLVLMALTLEHLDDKDNASRAYERAVQLSPEGLTVRLNYAQFLITTKQLDQARYHLSIAADIARKMPNLDKKYLDAITSLKKSFDLSISEFQGKISRHPVVHSSISADDKNYPGDEQSQWEDKEEDEV